MCKSGDSGSLILVIKSERKIPKNVMTIVKCKISKVFIKHFDSNLPFHIC